MSAKRGLKPEMKEVVEWAAQYGWSLDDDVRGSGHYTLSHPEVGVPVVVSATASDHRAVANTKAEIRRLSGIKSDSGPAGKYTHKPRRRSERFDMDVAVREQAEYRERLLQAERERQAQQVEITAEITRLKVAHLTLMAQLNKCDARRDQKQARGLAVRIVEIERRLKDLEG